MSGDLGQGYYHRWLKLNKVKSKRYGKDELIETYIYVEEELEDYDSVRGWTLLPAVVPSREKWDYTKLDWRVEQLEWTKITVNLREYAGEDSYDFVDTETEENEVAKVGVISPGKQNNLQVVIKAQSYNMLEHQGYSGRWHVEGATENVVAVGVYYTQIDQSIEKNCLF
eukprot:TRINITY_DN6463_c0_g1_i2.p1 TRINITY_DN6463_c0_g1~~TRINITY_DN6463_c0_g1_i2.p1  ORF type:complete len:169 (+),score=41.43 TRINITY_DN6463_c0_g1_i2:144-650(+)